MRPGSQRHWQARNTQGQRRSQSGGAATDDKGSWILGVATHEMGPVAIVRVIHCRLRWPIDQRFDLKSLIHRTPNQLMISMINLKLPKGSSRRLLSQMLHETVAIQAVSVARATIANSQNCQTLIECLRRLIIGDSDRAFTG
jgi:hypothetical protein